ncbi:hypothetical protein ACF0H5_018378 [Mactra antiquata]
MSSKTCSSEGKWETGVNTSLEYTVYDNCSKHTEPQIFQVSIILGIVINVIGIVLLTPAIGVFLAYSTLRRQQRIKIHTHLFSSILMASILSLTWDVTVRLDRLNKHQSQSVMYTYQVFCKTLNVVHRFARASMIFWMSCEGFYLHQLLVNTFTQPRHLYGYCWYGWEERFNNLDMNTNKIINEKLDVRVNVKSQIKDEVRKTPEGVVENRFKEMEDRSRRRLNIVAFNMEE